MHNKSVYRFLTYTLVLLFFSHCSNTAEFSTKNQSGGDKNSKDGNSGGDGDGIDVNGKGSENSSASDGNGDTDGKNDDFGNANPADFVEIKSEDDLIAACNNPSTAMELTQEVVFPEPKGTCTWGTDDVPKDGNLGQLNGRLSARFEESMKLTLPENALLCNLSMDFGDPNAGGQQMYYDDEIFLTYNKVVLAASQSYSDRLPTKSGLLLYDWTKLVGTSYSQDYEVYCLGAKEGLGSCSIPMTQTQGIVKISFDDSIVRKVALETASNIEGSQSKQGTDHLIGFVTLGDNDSPIDCKHSTFKIQVKGQYILKK